MRPHKKTKKISSQVSNRVTFQTIQEPFRMPLLGLHVSKASKIYSETNYAVYRC